MDLEKSIQHYRKERILIEELNSVPSIPSPSPFSSPSPFLDPVHPPSCPYINPETKFWEVSLFDVDCLAIGNGLLGCGGGLNLDFKNTKQ